MLNQRSKYCQIWLIFGNQEENEEEREDLGLRRGGGYCMRVSALVIWRILHKRAAVWDVIDKGWAQGKGVLVEWEEGGGGGRGRVET